MATLLQVEGGALAQSNGGRSFELSRANLLLLILLTAVGSVACFVWAANVHGTMSLVASALASALLSVAVATLATEVLLKPAFTRDVIRLVGLRDRIHAIGMQDAVPANELRWQDLYQGAASIEFVVTRPSQWVADHLGRILDGCRRRPTVVTVYLPNPGSEASRLTAATIGANPGVYDAEVLQAANDVETAWRQARDRTQLDSKCSLSIEYVQSAPLHGGAMLGETMVVLLPAFVPDRVASDLGFVFHGAGSSDVAMWLSQRWVALRADIANTPAYREGRH